MDDYSEIEFVEARNAPNNHRVVVARPGQHGGRTFVAQPRSYGQSSPYVYANPGACGVGIGSGPVFGRMSTGLVIDMVAQIFAALMPLPATPNVTGDADTDSGNTILFQTALAQYAKRDEQIRTLGNLIVKLVG
jgi:hypothetical protein